MAHARYTRAEVFAAMGVSAIDRPKEHREGVYFEPDLRTQLMFVTLNKDEPRSRRTSSTRTTQSRPTSSTGSRPTTGASTRDAKCIGVGPDASEHRLLFVRERS